VKIIVEKFGIPLKTVNAFFDAARKMNFFDDQAMTTDELFEKFFPGRDDVVRLLMEPITYANGSTLEDPAITYGIVFSNFMHKGVFTFQGGTDLLIGKMKEELVRNGVDIRIRCRVEQIEISPDRKVTGVVVNGKRIGCKAIVSNANLKQTILKLVGEKNLDADFVEQTKAVRLNNSSCQVYIALKPEETIENVGDLLFHSEHTGFNVEAMLSKDISSRTFSFYYPQTRPHADPRNFVVSSTNANYKDWADLTEEEYIASKDEMISSTLDCLEQYVPGIHEKVDHVEASTPKTFEHYTLHMHGASFGTKFEGLKVSKDLPEQIAGLYHAGSVGIIMSGWLGAVNYGVIVCNEVDKYLTSAASV